jgi:outer membrane PBP1 activator LpoA protein
MAKKSSKETDPRLESLPKKIRKALEGDTDFLDKAQQASKEELNKLMVTAQELIVDFEKDYEADIHVQELKEQLKDASSTYKDGIKINQARATYCVYIKRSLG